MHPSVQLAMHPDGITRMACLARARTLPVLFDKIRFVGGGRVLRANFGSLSAGQVWQVTRVRVFPSVRVCAYNVKVL
jgi:hypothetical protein